MLAQIRVPGANGASAPAAVIVPTTSTPGVKGSAGLRWYRPRSIRVSRKFTPAASTWIR